MLYLKKNEYGLVSIHFSKPEGKYIEVEKLPPGEGELHISKDGKITRTQAGGPTLIEPAAPQEDVWDEMATAIKEGVNEV